MTERIKAFFTSTKTQVLSFLLSVISLILAAVCFVIPLGRQHWAIQSLGSATQQQLSSLAMSITHYEPQRLRYLLATKHTGPTYDKLVELLAQAKREYGYERLYLVYREESGLICCLVDADYDSSGAFVPGTSYLRGYYDSNSLKALDRALDGRDKGGYLEEIYDDNLILAQEPLVDQEGQVLALLCADAPLTYTDFSQFYGVELGQVAESLAALFVASFVCFVIGRSFAAGEDDDNDKGGGRWVRPTVTQQENNVYIDPLDDVDPNDYL